MDQTIAFCGHHLIIAAIWLILTLSLNLINGFCGLFSLGHQGFWAVGAYSSAVLLNFLLAQGCPELLAFGLTFPFGMLMAAIFGLLVGLPCLRLRGDYLAIATLGFSEILRNIVLNSELLGMSLGLSVPNIIRRSVEERRNAYFIYFALVLVAILITVFVLRNLIRSSHGRAIMAIRDDDRVAELLGVNLTRYKVLVFVTGAAFAGLAGALFANYNTLVTPDDYSFNVGHTEFTLIQNENGLHLMDTQAVLTESWREKSSPCARTFKTSSVMQNIPINRSGGVPPPGPLLRAKREVRRACRDKIRMGTKAFELCFLRGEPLIDVVASFHPNINVDAAVELINASFDDLDFHRAPYYISSKRIGTASRAALERIFDWHVSRFPREPGEGVVYGWITDKEPDLNHSNIIKQFIQSIGMSQPGADDNGQWWEYPMPPTSAINWLQEISQAAETDTLRAVVLRMIEAKLNRLEIYNLFITAMLSLRAQNKEAEEDRVLDELDCIYGWGSHRKIPGLDYDIPLPN